MRADVVVVGGGVMGLATAYALAREGRDALVLEQFRLGHTRGSSHGASRIFRLAHREPEWVKLARESLAAWRELEAEAGEPLLELNGIVELLIPGDDGSRKALEECGVPWEELEPAEVERRYGVHVPDGFEPILQPEAGITYADRAYAAFRAGAAGHGARIVEDTRVLSLADDRVETTAGEVEAEAVVVTAGAWARKLLATGGIDLPVTETIQTVSYFRLQQKAPLPAVVDWDPEGKRHAMYALPDPNIGLKVGAHGYGPSTDPDEPGAPDPLRVEKIAEWTRERFPGADPEPARSETCLYTSTVDDSFILERHGRIVVGSACSGHGFKFAPVVGRRLAELATG
jgi:sarcosine oxidase